MGLIYDPTASDSLQSALGGNLASAAQLTADLRRVGNVLLAEWQRKAGDDGRKVIEVYRNQQ